MIQIPASRFLSILLFIAIHCVVQPDCIATAAPPKTDGTKLISDQWQIVLLADQRIGYGRTTINSIIENNKTLITTRTESKLKIKRFGQTITMQSILATRETVDGQLISFEQITRNPPAASNKISGSVRENELIMSVEIAGRKSNRRIPWQTDVKSPTYLDRLLTLKLMHPNQVLRYKTFFPDYGKIGTVTLTAANTQQIKLHQGNKINALLVRMTESVQPTLTTSLFLDARGNAVKSETDLLGRKMTTYTVAEEVALQQIAGTELDLAIDTLIQVKPIPNPHQTQKIVYRIKGHKLDVSQYLKSSPTQTVKKIDNQTCELTVLAVKPPQRTVIGKVDPQFLAETSFLQLSDYEVIKHARRAAAAETNLARVATRMEKYVHEKLRTKNFSTALASAAEVAKNLEGDCTEHAVLLAAMLRVMKIPSRVATGLVYVPSRSSFGGHMWTEAYLNNQWIPLDATLGRGGIGAAHIKLGDSSLDDNAPAPVTAFLPLLNLLGKIEISVIKVDATR